MKITLSWIFFSKSFSDLKIECNYYGKKDWFNNRLEHKRFPFFKFLVKQFQSKSRMQLTLWIKIDIRLIENSYRIDSNTIKEDKIGAIKHKRFLLV